MTNPAQSTNTQQSAHQIKKYLTEYLDQLVPILLQKAKEVRS